MGTPSLPSLAKTNKTIDPTVSEAHQDLPGPSGTPQTYQNHQQPSQTPQNSLTTPPNSPPTHTTPNSAPQEGLPAHPISNPAPVGDPQDPSGPQEHPTDPHEGPQKTSGPQEDPTDSHEGPQDTSGPQEDPSGPHEDPQDPEAPHKDPLGPHEEPQDPQQDHSGPQDAPQAPKGDAMVDVVVGSPLCGGNLVGGPLDEKLGVPTDGLNQPQGEFHFIPHPLSPPYVFTRDGRRISLADIRYPLADTRHCQRIPASGCGFGCGCPVSPKIQADIRVSLGIPGAKTQPSISSLHLLPTANRNQLAICYIRTIQHPSTPRSIPMSSSTGSSNQEMYNPQPLPLSISSENYLFDTYGDLILGPLSTTQDLLLLLKDHRGRVLNIWDGHRHPQSAIIDLMLGGFHKINKVLKDELQPLQIPVSIIY
ncbi:hypothetical protein PGTUg99_021622 [Puccinia graminis f. sp. tritici]|nr:hypothetical protein PGTUg99_021622 [Puccinia graminis f. sp. tritici]